MRRLALSLLLLPALAGATGGHAFDPAEPELELVVRQDGQGYHYELHPVGLHGAVDGKFYGSSELALQGAKQLVMQMPYPNPETVQLDPEGLVDASFVFGVTNRGQGDYTVQWSLAAGDAVVAQGTPQSFALQGQQTDVGFQEVVWEAPARVAAISANAEVVLTVDIEFTGNAPYVKDRGVRLELPAARPANTSAQPAAQPTDGPGPSPAPSPASPLPSEEAPLVADPAGGSSRSPAVGADRTWLWVPAVLAAGLAAMAVVSRRR